MAGCTVDYSGAGAIDLATRTLVPGIYCADAFALSGTLNLDDTLGSDGVWIFRSASTLITSAGVNAKVQFLHGTGFACNVWWKVGSSATIGSGTAFTGNILALTAITMGTGASLDGRAMAQTAAVTLDSNIISGPTCVSPPQGGGGGPALGSITVIKTVINDNGGTKKVSDFPLFVNNIQVASGSANSFFASNTPYAISETSNA